ncbi:MAG: aspartate kinase [Planctomycetota bacterium]
MSVIVQKFGGTSVADATKIAAAADRAVAAAEAGHDVCVVVSARGKKTDELVALAAAVTDTPSDREMDVLLSTGEQENIALMAMAIAARGRKATSFTGRQLGITTDSTHAKARIRAIDTSRIEAAFGRGEIVVAAGFQGLDEKGSITTLGRGGSDLTATALAAVLGAERCEIYTDVTGVYTTDPRIVPEARKLATISHEEMLELASLGAGVMHSRAVEFAKKYGVAIEVRHAGKPDPGTVIAAIDPEQAPVVAGVALVKETARLTLVELPDRPGVMDVIFTEMAARAIPIDMVVQDFSAGGRAEVSFTVPQTDLAEALDAANHAVEKLGSGRVLTGTGVAKVSVVGLGMTTHTGVAAEMFRALADAGINVELVTTSEIKISVLVERGRAVEAVGLIHRTFGLHDERPALPRFGGVSDEVPSAVGDKAAEQAVVGKLAAMEDIVVSAVELDLTQSRVSLAGVPDRPGLAAQVFSTVAEGAVVVDMIVQNAGHDGLASISFTVLATDVDRCLMLVTDVCEAHPGVTVSHDREIAKLTVTGIGLRTHTGVGERLFRTLAGEGVNVQMVNTSEIRVGVVLSPEEGRNVVGPVRSAFGLD